MHWLYIFPSLYKASTLILKVTITKVFLNSNAISQQGRDGDNVNIVNSYVVQNMKKKHEIAKKVNVGFQHLKKQLGMLFLLFQQNH